MLYEFGSSGYWTKRLNMVAERLKHAIGAKDRETLLSLHEHYIRLAKQAEEREASQSSAQRFEATSQAVQTDRRRSKRAV